MNNTIVAFASTQSRGCRLSSLGVLLLLFAAGSDCGGTGDVLVPVLTDAGTLSDAPVGPVKAQRVDLLLVIDNSASMADKQAVLASAIPKLLEGLANPPCVDIQSKNQVFQPILPSDSCPASSKRLHSPIRDMHVGVITSSLGGHGADSCSNSGVGASTYNPTQEDMSHLITRTDGDPIPTWQDKGFFFWDPAQSSSPPGTADLAALEKYLANVISGAGQTGCGFEAPLEAWYRFLVDPNPYESMVPYDCSSGEPAPEGNCRGPSGVDQTVLAQRSDFLRPDSLVTVLMLTDEDDCSVVDKWQNYLVLQAYAGANPWNLPRATSTCASEPSSPLCMSCGTDTTGDPECAKGPYTTQEDALNVRCWRQKQRFGIDFLYPVSRYVQALKNPFFFDGRVNPLFCSSPSTDGMSCTAPLRDSSLVVLAGIVGVPWQDVARDPNDISKGLLAASELPWDVIAGDLVQYKDPTDPFMIPSIDPRTGTNPLTGIEVSPPSSASPIANPINGHEWNILPRGDLQYACTFELPEPKDCSGDAVSCDCTEVDGMMNPLCQSSAGEYGKIQYRAKAYPAVRILTVLKGLGSRAAVGSICPQQLSDPSAASYGYLPALQAVLAVMRASF